jgi:transposase
MKTITDPQALEQRRLRAARLVRQGKKVSEAAQECGVTIQAVYRWVKAYNQGGNKALKSKGKRGVQPRLTFSQKRQLLKELAKGAQSHGYPSDLWTQERIAEVCKKKFDVTYHFNHVGKLLKALGWSWQKPTGRAIERNEREVRRWLKEDWPRIKKKPEGREKALFL